MNAAESPLREWQTKALDAWKLNNRRGIASVVTGGGKTIFALHCIKYYRQHTPAATSVIVVPTEALLDQWIAEIIAFFNIPISYLTILNSRSKISLSRIHIGVINTVANIAIKPKNPPIFLIVDECHKAASPTFKQIFNFETEATLGLSATPERQYDQGLDKILIPALGSIISNYTYRDALRDKVIVPFTLHNIIFEFSAEEQKKYNKLTNGIHASIKKYGSESQQVVTLLLRRSRLSNSSYSRVKIALQIVAKHRTQKILIFHEDIAACEAMHKALEHYGMRSGIYHSGMSLKNRISTLGEYRKGQIQVLVSCRALDEGFNVPETEIGIIAASTATHRQRVQRLGRVLRPASGKTNAIVYSIVAAPTEIKRLAAEAETLDDIVEVIWSKA